jgi:hypothetical protein
VLIANYANLSLYRSSQEKTVMIKKKMGMPYFPDASPAEIWENRAPENKMTTPA